MAARRQNRRLRRQRRQPRHHGARSRRRERPRWCESRSLRRRRHGRCRSRSSPGPARPLRLDPQRAVSRPEPRRSIRRAAASPRSAARRCRRACCWISTDLSGRFLLSASYGSSLVAVSPIGPERRRRQRRSRSVADRSGRRTRSSVDPASNRFAFVDLPRRRRVARQMRFDAGRPASLADNDRAGVARARPAPDRAISSFPSASRRSSTCSTSSMPRSTCSRCRPRARPRGAAPQTVSLLPRRFDGWRAVGRRASAHARRPLPLRQRARARARSPRFAVDAGARHADAARDGADRGRAARLRDHARRPLSASPSARPRIASAAMRIDGASGALRLLGDQPVGTQSELGRDRRAGRD